MADKIEAHFERIKNHMDEGRKTLHALEGAELHTYDVPNVVADQSISLLKAPEPSDK